MSLSSDSVDAAIANIHKIYSATSFNPPNGQWTILACFYLTSEELGHEETKIISLATGTKCLPEARLPACGEAVHDSHAEVLARRGAVRWFLEEIVRYQESQTSLSPSQSPWIRPIQTIDGRCLFDIRDGVKVNLYISTVPCGDASMRYLASAQDQEMAALKASSVFPDLEPNAASRGRDNYARLGVLRTKPGRADSPRTRCMSCSDKIAAWNVLGFQGALASRFLRQIYLSHIVIGEVPIELQSVVLEDCERALWKRLEGRLESISVHRPHVSFTDVPFLHSRSVVEQKTPIQGSCVESLCWVADSVQEVLINGLKRGVAPKHRFREKSRQCIPQLSKATFFHTFAAISAKTGHVIPNSTTYLDAKRSSLEYQEAKQRLMGPSGPFSGWVKTGDQTENFVLVPESNSH